MLRMFDAFDDDFSEDQGFLCEPSVRNSVQVVSQKSSWESTTEKSLPTNTVAAALDEKKITQYPITERSTSSKSRLKKFSFLRRHSSNLNEDIVGPCTNKKLKNVATSASELSNFNSTELLVLQDSLDSLDKDGFSFDDSNSGDNVCISTPLNLNHAPNTTDRLCDRIFVPLPITSNLSTSLVSSGSSSSKTLMFTSVSTPAISNESCLMKRNNIAIGRTNIIFENSELLVSENQSMKSKRKFPGPAGLLPKFSRLPESNELFKADVNSLTAGSYKKSAETLTDSQLPSNMEIPCSQLCEDPFQKSPWLAMMKDISQDDNGQHQQILNKFNISSVLKQANNQKALFNLKFPMLCVLLNSINTTDQPDASAVFKDKTGCISGMICQKLVQELSQQLHFGSVLVLKQIMIMKLPSKRYCLNITPLSIVAIYSENDRGDVEHLALNPISWGTLLQDANESPPSPLIRRPCLKSKSISPYNITPLLSPGDFPSLSNRAWKYGKNTPNSTTPTHVPCRPSSLPMITAGSSSCSDSVMHRNPLHNVPGRLSDNSIQSFLELPSNSAKSLPTIPNENVNITDSTRKDLLQKSNLKLRAGGDFADDPLWTDDDFDSLLLNIDMANAI